MGGDSNMQDLTSWGEDEPATIRQVGPTAKRLAVGGTSKEELEDKLLLMRSQLYVMQEQRQDRAGRGVVINMAKDTQMATRALGGNEAYYKRVEENPTGKHGSPHVWVARGLLQGLLETEKITEAEKLIVKQKVDALMQTPKKLARYILNCRAKECAIRVDQMGLEAPHRAVVEISFMPSMEQVIHIMADVAEREDGRWEEGTMARSTQERRLQE
jgi:hypothetical protein